VSDSFTLYDWQTYVHRRPNWDEFFMMMAELASSRSTCDRGSYQRFRDRKGVGAVIVTPDHRSIAIGYAGSPPGAPHCDDQGHLIRDNHCIRTVHAEENAIINATFGLRGCSLYTTTFPCYHCVRRIVSVGIKKVLYGDTYVSQADPDVRDLLSTSRLEVVHLQLCSGVKQ